LSWWQSFYVAAIIGVAQVLQTAQATSVVNTDAGGDEFTMPSEVLALAQAVVTAADQRDMPFAIVDKRAAVMMVFRKDGTRAGQTPVLLGMIPGDRSAPGVGDRAQQGRLRQDDRTTPAGRFESEPGHNLAGEQIVWVDYGSALAIHRLRPGASHERRTRGIASKRPLDRRLSDGCIVVPEAFYRAIVQAELGHGRALVYVMPEERPWQALWPQLAAVGGGQRRHDDTIPTPIASTPEARAM
jgi:hypothetical protein